MNKENDIKFLPLVVVVKKVPFPNMDMKFMFQKSKNTKAVDFAMRNHDGNVLLALPKDPSLKLYTEKEFIDIAVLAKIDSVLSFSDGDVRISVETMNRVRLKKVSEGNGFFNAMFEKIEEAPLLEETEEIKTLMSKLKVAFQKFHDLCRGEGEFKTINLKIGNPIPDNIIVQDVQKSIENEKNVSVYLDKLAGEMTFQGTDKVRLLRAIDVKERLLLTIELLIEKINYMKAKQEIEYETRLAMDENNRDHILKAQLAIIKKKIGETKQEENTLNVYQEKLNEIKDVLEPAHYEKLLVEAERVFEIPQSSPEYLVAKDYLDMVFSMPWKLKTKSDYSINDVEKILDEDHYGLKDVKLRILEFLSVMRVEKILKSPVLCLVGPPGVGKTSIAKSIARALNRKYVRMSLGGLSDESEIRGHRKTYIGSMPGRIIKGLKDAKSNNPVFLMDEIDKLGKDFRGDPSSSLLELFDPEQNKYFVDRYLEIPFDCSDVFFVTTANTLDTIPAPLLDRMEIIQINGYTLEEKIAIAKNYLVKRKMTDAIKKNLNIKFTNEAIKTLVNNYTRESGVRNLEREIEKVIRKIVLEKMREDGKDEGPKKTLVLKKDDIKNYLGKYKVLADTKNKKKEVGIVTGLAWTAVGGTILEIESVLFDGQGKLVLSGQLGDVMKESGTAAFSYIKFLSRNDKELLAKFKENDVHIHVPEGAVRKDGPSAGITMFITLYSLFHNLAVRPNVAMTGEITIRGKILPVGGIKEKVLAAFRAGIKEIILPVQNEADTFDIPEYLREKIKFHFIEKAEDAIKIVFK